MRGSRNGSPGALGFEAQQLAAVGQPLALVFGLGGANGLQLAGHDVFKILCAIAADELFNKGVFEAQHLEKAEVQVVIFELEHLPQQVLKLPERAIFFFHVGIVNDSGSVADRTASRTAAFCESTSLALLQHAGLALSTNDIG